MLRKYIIFTITVTFVLMLSGFVYTRDNVESDTVIINSINVNTDSGLAAAENIEFKDALSWAYNYRLTLIPDAPPVVDNKAVLITQFQTVIPVTGYNRNLFYKIYIDLFRYSQPEVPFNSKLKIIIRDIYGSRREIGTADVRAMTGSKIFEVSVPFELSYPGKFDIIIHEYAVRTGSWGIWDIIVSSKKLNEIEIMPMEFQEKIKDIEPKIFE